MKQITCIIFVLSRLFCPVQASDNHFKDEFSRLNSNRSTYHSFSINGDDGALSGSEDDLESNILNSHSENSPDQQIVILSMSHPHRDREDKIDHHVFQPLLYIGNAIFYIGLMEAIYYQSLEAGFLPLEIGLGIVVGTLACKTLARCTSGLLDWCHQKSEEKIIKRTKLYV